MYVNCSAHADADILDVLNSVYALKREMAKKFLRRFEAAVSLLVRKNVVHPYLVRSFYGILFH